MARRRAESRLISSSTRRFTEASMGKWMDLAAQLEAGAGSEDNRDNRDNSPPNVPIVPNVPGLLPPDLSDGLESLRAMAAPRITRPEVWPEIVSDALLLARDGWAETAMALGWSPLQLWGCSPDRGGNPADDGLAVWLAGRRVLLIDGASCIVESGPKARAVFSRRPAAGAVFLWQLGSAAKDI